MIVVSFIVMEFRLSVSAWSDEAINSS